MVWCSVVNCYLIGPYFFYQNVNARNYLEILRDHLDELMKDVDLATRQRMWFQQDGAGPLFGRDVHAFLNTRLEIHC